MSVLLIVIVIKSFNIAGGFGDGQSGDSRAQRGAVGVETLDREFSYQQKPVAFVDLKLWNLPT
jgi:hypothetical protein